VVRELEGEEKHAQQRRRRRRRRRRRHKGKIPIREADE
jgi:hypothetical protein